MAFSTLDKKQVRHDGAIHTATVGNARAGIRHIVGGYDENQGIYHPGVLMLDSIDSSGVTGQHALWINDTTNAIKISTDISALPTTNALFNTASSYNPSFDGLTIVSQGLTLTAGNVTASAGKISAATTLASATPGADNRIIYGKVTTFSSATTSGTMCGVRGEANLGANFGSGAAAYIYGTQGKLITNARTIAIGSGHACGVMAQLDCSSGTLTSGHIACLICSVQDTNNNAIRSMSGIYIEAPTYGSGGGISQAIEVTGSLSNLLNISGAGAAVSAAAGTTQAASGAKKIGVLIDSTQYYLLAVTALS